MDAESSNQQAQQRPRKRQRPADPAHTSPLLDMFKGFRERIDAMHDQRERIIKTSRDITAESKKVIFTLQRITGSESQASIFEEAQRKLDEIKLKFLLIAPDVQGSNFHRFNKQITPGLQEFTEAVSFFHFLQTGELITLEAVQKTYFSRDEVLLFPLTEEDFLLGVSDVTGELMRYAINSVAAGDSDRAFSVLSFLRLLTSAYQNISSQHVFGIRKKVAVMETSLEKVEKACYTITVRGSEYPKEMLAKFLLQDQRESNNDNTANDADS